MAGPGSGYARAVTPTAAAVHTPADGLAAGAVRIPAGGRRIPAYRAAPEGGGPWPIVLVAHEVFGVHEHIRDCCRRLAREGYLAVAPDLFARHGEAEGLQSFEEIQALVARVADAEVMADLDAAAAWAAGAGGGDGGRLGITGFCWGGRTVWLYAAHSPALRAGVSWYGRLDGPRTAHEPRFPVDLAAELRAPVLGLYGGADPHIPPETIERMRASLPGGPSEIVVYPDAPHGFYADYRESYREGPARDGWRRMLDWLRRHGVA